MKDDYGFLTCFMNNNLSDFANQEIQVSPSKQIMLDGKIASEAQQAAGKEFLKKKRFYDICTAGHVLFFAVVIIPFVYGIYLTLTDWNGVAAGAV